MPESTTPVLVCDVGAYALRRRPLLVGLPIAGLAGVGPCGPITPVPGAAPEVLGLTTFQDQVVPVFSTARLLGLPSAGPERPAQIVTFRVGAGLAALAVEAVTGSIRPQHYVPTSALSPITSPALVGTVPRREGWLAVIDPCRIPSLHLRAA